MKQSASFATALLVSFIGHATAFAFVLTRVPRWEIPSERIITVFFDESSAPAPAAASTGSLEAGGIEAEPKEHAAALNEALQRATPPEAAIAPPITPTRKPRRRPTDPKPGTAKTVSTKKPTLVESAAPAGATTGAPSTRPDESNAQGRAGGTGTTYDASLLGISAVYPRYARQHNQAGRVVCRVRIDASGKIITAEVMQSSRYPVLDEAAVEALKGARFNAVDHDRPREAFVTFAFRLEE